MVSYGKLFFGMKISFCWNNAHGCSEVSIEERVCGNEGGTVLSL